MSGQPELQKTTAAHGLPSEGGEPLWDEAAAAAWLNISRRTVRRLPVDILPVIKIGRQVKRYVPADVRAVATRLRVSGGAEAAAE